MSRFTVRTEGDTQEVSIFDEVKDNYPFVLVCESIDDYDILINECLNCSDLLNELESEIQRLKRNIHCLQKENTELSKLNRSINDETDYYRRTVNHLTTLLAEATRQGFEVGLDEIKENGGVLHGKE